ncbi:hypothetical protein V8B97DRAFT_270552 [Scleroderma yunnanense]
MIDFIRRLLGFNQVDTTCEATAQSPFKFSGCACFSKHVPQAMVQKWVAFGGKIYTPHSPSQATYFFAMDTADKWVTTLTSRSVIVIHALWIIHCIEHGFQIPISKYVLDNTRGFPAADLPDGFARPRAIVPQTPHKLLHGLKSSDPGTEQVANALLPAHDALHSQPNESSHSSLVQPATPSTPLNTLQKRKREPCYFDSPSRSLVFSEFDKDGLPRRPRKQRRLRFIRSFTPIHDKENMSLTWADISNHGFPLVPATDDPVKDWAVKNDVIVGMPIQPSLSAAEGPARPTTTKSFPFSHFTSGPAKSSAITKRVHTIDFTRLAATDTFQFPGIQLQPHDPNIVKQSNRIGMMSGDLISNRQRKLHLQATLWSVFIATDPIPRL